MQPCNLIFTQNRYMLVAAPPEHCDAYKIMYVHHIISRSICSSILYMRLSYSLCSVMIAQWNSSLSVLPVARVQFLSIPRNFFLADHTLPTRPEPAWQKMAQSPLNDTTQPLDSEEEGRSPTTDRRWLIEKK